MLENIKHIPLFFMNTKIVSKVSRKGVCNTKVLPVKSCDISQANTAIPLFLFMDSFSAIEPLTSFACARYAVIHQTDISRYPRLKHVSKAPYTYETPTQIHSHILHMHIEQHTPTHRHKNRTVVLMLSQ